MTIFPITGCISNQFSTAIRATKELEGAKVAAKSFRENPEFDTFSVLTELGVGEALVSVLDEKGVPTIVKKTSILPPQSFMGIIDNDTRNNVIRSNPMYSKFYDVIDRESAYEILMNVASQGMENADAKAEYEQQAVAASAKEAEEKSDEQKRIEELEAELAAAKAERDSKVKKPNPNHPGKAGKAEKESTAKPAKAESSTAKAYKRAAKSVASTASGTIGREIGNTIGSGFGKFGKKLGGNVGASIGRNLMGIMFK